MDTSEGFIPIHGGYRNLLSFQNAVIVYDGTVYFCQRFFKKYDRTIDQMVQAARSGKQNIVEGSMASATSKETEIKLTNVARASLEELLADYEDFMRLHGVEKWGRDHRLSKRFDELLRTPSATYETFKKAIEHEDASICVNVLWCLTNVTIFLLNKQLQSLEKAFIKEGGLRERMFAARVNERNKGK